MGIACHAAKEQVDAVAPAPAPGGDSPARELDDIPLVSAEPAASSAAALSDQEG